MSELMSGLFTQTGECFESGAEQQNNQKPSSTRVLMDISQSLKMVADSAGWFDGVGTDDQWSHWDLMLPASGRAPRTLGLGSIELQSVRAHP